MMNTIDDFVALVHDELGLPVTVDDEARALHELPGWDSMHLLWLVGVLEQRTGRELRVVDILDAPNLRSIFEIAMSPR
jgi:acyl carrier protein